MDFFKRNPVFSALLGLIILLLIGGVVMNVMIQGQVQQAEKSVQSAKRQLDSALALEPAPTEANVEAAQANVKALKAELEKRIESTRGNKPTLLKGQPPASGTQMLFLLNAYRNEIAQVAGRTVPYGVTDEQIEEMKAKGEPIPSTTVPQDSSFGFSRYTQTPPKDADVPKIFQQYEILNYVLRKLLSTGPKSIVSVQRGPVELPPPSPESTGRGGNRNAEAALKPDEFRVGSESAAVEGAVETLAFKIVFTGYTESLRSFLKQIEEFEAPIVVRSVEAVPLESSVNVAASAPSAPATAFDLFGGVGADNAEETEQTKDAGREPIVADNVSEFTVVLEYILVNFTKTAEETDGDDEEEDLS